MSSQRKEIRAYIVAMLNGIAGLESANAVYPNRVKKLFPNEMPALVVYTRSEQSEVGVEAPRSYERKLRVAVEVITDRKTEEADPDDVVDDICSEIETRIFRDETLGGLVSDTRLTDTEMETDSEGETMHASARVTFEVTYWTDAPEEQTGLADFKKVHSEMLPAGAIEDDTAPAIDDVLVDEEEEEEP